MIRQSVVYWAFTRQCPVDALIRAAAEIGFRSIEMAPEEHWPTIKAAGLEIAIVPGHASLTDGLNRPENHEQEINYPAVMRAIAEAGYEGYVGHEYVPKGDWRRSLEHAFRTCNV